LVVGQLMASSHRGRCKKSCQVGRKRPVDAEWSAKMPLP
jgi:hypothetical protein